MPVSPAAAAWCRAVRPRASVRLSRLLPVAMGDVDLWHVDLWNIIIFGKPEENYRKMDFYPLAIKHGLLENEPL